MYHGVWLGGDLIFHRDSAQTLEALKCALGQKKRSALLFLFFRNSPADLGMLVCDLGLSISCPYLWWCPFCTSKIRVPVRNFNQHGEWGGERGGTERERESGVGDWLWKRVREGWVCEKQRDSKGKGGGDRTCICCAAAHSISQHMAALQCLQTRQCHWERARKSEERERSQKKEEKEQGKHNCKNGIRMTVLSQQGIIYCIQERTELPVGFRRRSVSSGCFALWAVIAAAIGTVRHLNWGCSKAWSQEQHL